MTPVKRSWLWVAAFNVAFMALHVSGGNYGWAVFSGGVVITALALMLADVNGSTD